VCRDAPAEFDLAVEEERPLRVGLRRGEAYKLKRLAGQIEKQLSALVLEHRPKLDEIGDETTQACVWQQPRIGERHRRITAGDAAASRTWA
jgi:hypothetical protein